MKSKVKNKGITLISLVITIIVLLILAGISIATLTGENGILVKAINARNRTNKANVKEQINLSLIASRINDTLDIDLNKLENELNNIKEINAIEKQGDNKQLPWIVSTDKYKFQITEDGKIEEVIGIALNKTNIKLLKDESESVKATLTEGATGNIVWSSSNTEIATVEPSSGNSTTITAIGESGTAIITAKVEGTSYSVDCCLTILSPVTSISTASPKIALLSGTTGKIDVTTEPSTDVESLTFSSSDSNIATVDENGIITGLNEGTATITIAGSRSTNVNTQVTVVIKKLSKGKFVKYNVEYKDINNTSYNYSTTNGWRLLNYTDNKDGTYSNVELISTGIPARLNYNYREIGYSNTWFEKDNTKLNSFKTILGNGYNLSTSSDYPALYSSAGLYYNLANIALTHTSNSLTDNNMGEFYYIKNNNSTYDNNIIFNVYASKLFKVNDNISVRTLTLPEINLLTKEDNDINSTTQIPNTGAKADSTGLFRLDQLQNVSGMSSYAYNSGKYYIASPYPNSDANALSQITYNGEISSNTYGLYGIRPVVCLNANVTFSLSEDGNYFEIK